MNNTMENYTPRILHSLNDKLVLGVTIVIFTGIALSLQVRNKADRLLHIPTVGKKGWESSRRREFMSNAAKLYAEGYQKVRILFLQTTWRIALTNENSIKMVSFASQQLEVSCGLHMPAVFSDYDRIAVYRCRASIFT